MSLRSALSVAVILLAALGVHHFLGDTERPTHRDPDETVGGQRGGDGGKDEPRATRRVSADHATLVVHLIGPDRAPIARGEVGIDNGGAVRWLPTGVAGVRTITDLAPGAVRVLGRATGRKQTEQKRRVTAGVRTEVKLVLQPDS